MNYIFGRVLVLNSQIVKQSTAGACSCTWGQHKSPFSYVRPEGGKNIRLPFVRAYLWSQTGRKLTNPKGPS